MWTPNFVLRGFPYFSLFSPRERLQYFPEFFHVSFLSNPFGNFLSLNPLKALDWFEFFLFVFLPANRNRWTAQACRNPALFLANYGVLRKRKMQRGFEKCQKNAILSTELEVCVIHKYTIALYHYGRQLCVTEMTFQQHFPPVCCLAGVDCDKSRSGIWEKVSGRGGDGLSGIELPIVQRRLTALQYWALERWRSLDKWWAGKSNKRQVKTNTGALSHALHGHTCPRNMHQTLL